MKPIYILLACFLLPGVVRAQTSSANPDSSANDTNLAAEVKALREALLQTQKQMAAQQQEIETLKARSKDGATRTVTNEPAPRPSETAGADSATSSVESSTEHAGANIRSETWKARSKGGATRTVTNEPAPRPSETAGADSATSSVESSTEHAGANI